MMTTETSPSTTPAHMHLDPSILSAADVPTGWWVGICWGERGAYEARTGCKPTSSAIKAGEVIAELTDVEIVVVPKVGQQRGAVCVVGADGRLYEIQPLDPTKLPMFVHVAWLVAVWCVKSPKSAIVRAEKARQ